MPPASPQLPPITGRELWGEGERQEEQASFRPKLERTQWLCWGGGNHPDPPFLPPTYCPCPEGSTVGLGSSQEPLTCLWQLWRDQRGVVRVGGAPPSQAVRAPALGAEAMAGQPGPCQSPSQVRWGQGPQQGWEWGQGQQQ